MRELPVVSISGGKDSTAMYLLAIEVYGMNFLPLFSDTGHEHLATVNYVRNLHVMCGGPQVIIVKANFKDKIREKRHRYLAQLRAVNPEDSQDVYNDLLYRARNCRPSGNPFLDMMLWKGRAPSTAAQFCTEWVKLWPILLYLEEHHPFDDYVMYTGLRAGESEARSKRQPFEYNSYFDCDSVNPMLYCSEEDIFALLREKGVPPNPLYALGYKRVGCFPCIHSNKKELELLPDWAWEKLAYWEKRLGRTWFAPDTMPPTKQFKAEIKQARLRFTNEEELEAAVSKIKLKYLPTIDKVRDWCKTIRGGVQFDIFKSQTETADAPACMSTWGHCE